MPRARTVSSACAGRISAIAMKAAVAAPPVAEIDLGFIAPTLLDGGVPPCPADIVARLFFCATAFP